LSALHFHQDGFELAASAMRPRAGAITRRGQILMKTIRPDNTDPIPLRVSQHRMGSIMIRFVALLLLAVVVMALAWR
jgi:hypothetical protein